MIIDPDKCQITHYPAEVLGKPAKPVEKIDDTIRRLVEKMKDIMVEHKGVGLAAPQAGVSLRVFIISLSGKKEEARAYVNPTVTPTTDEFIEFEEGCLSVPGVYTKIKRYKTCTVTATDLDGNEFTEEGEDFYARALQHEYDHIEGTTIVNRMSQVARIAHRKQLKKLREQQEHTEN
jgi:peptide deformylase